MAKTSNVLFASGNGYYPEFSGGVQSSTHHLVKQLQSIGHRPSVLAALFGTGVRGVGARIKMKLLRQGAVVDSFLGYPVVRAWYPWEAVEFAVKKLAIDVAVVQCHKSIPIGKALQAQGVPLVVYLRNVEFHELGGDLNDLHSARYIANSEFTAKAYKEKFGIESVVIPPTIDPAKYRTETTRDYITFVNPYEAKGFELAVRVAERCPEIPFLFVESWKLSPDHRTRIEKTIAPLKNVRLISRTSNMKTVYGRTKLLLVPSKWEEAWGRVASEAHCSGIPVVGSRRGGLPEAIGSGGVVLDYDAPLDLWVETVRDIWNNESRYQALSDAAVKFSQRPQMQPEKQFSIFLNTVIGAVAKA